MFPKEIHTSMDVEEDVCDTGLVLGLGYTKTTIGSRRDAPLKSEPAASNIPKPFEPSLTLGNLARQSSSSPHSPLSSFTSAFRSGAKRENESDREEEDGGSTRKKLRLTKEQSALLEDKFREHSTLNPKQKQALAKQLNLRPRQVEVWFQNRRARTKLKQTELDCEVLRRCCETLSMENRRLHTELQELKALKSAASPMYTRLPASSVLTVCPSCERAGGAGDGTAIGGPFVVAPKPRIVNHFARSATC
ncbi:homeobox-leucine zipper protein HAT22-like [Iris pallida]|uniref:Homeobox-leucine zipper protein HAT22-like n=1 Tax=Iris pallida TaxID=29817 RepID=A0AAX6DXG7_IRIPA|nr:homeobox-leucine zipper protein HAT22-like [Iris pallida]